MPTTLLLPPSQIFGRCTSSALYKDMSRTDGASWSQFLRASLTDTIIAQQASHYKVVSTIYSYFSPVKYNVLYKYEGKVDENFTLCLCTADGRYGRFNSRVVNNRVLQFAEI